MSFRGAIFDVDGVLVDSPHEQAWREGLQQLMGNEWGDVRDQTSYAPEKFTPEVYQRVMSGKPRYAGARAVLEHFGVPEPEERAREYGDRKQVMIVELIEAGRFHAYPDALRFVLAIKDAGLSYDFVRPGYTLLDTLDANVSGWDFEQGKPHPEIFLTAADEAGLSPEEAFVVEDAANGVQAAKAGNMAALGLARADDEELLADANADLVVTSLDDVSLNALAEGRLERKDD